MAAPGAAARVALSPRRPITQARSGFPPWVAASRMPKPLCPHCTLPLDHDPAPREVMRCPSCGLIVGPGRALHEPPPERRTGAAAGRRAARARRDAAGAERGARDAAELLATIATAAAGLREPRDLTMLEYERLRSGDESLPELSEVLAAFGTWKELSRRLRETRITHAEAGGSPDPRAPARRQGRSATRGKGSPKSDRRR